MSTEKCWAVNVKGPLALLRAAMPSFNANADGGAFIITSSIAVRSAILSGPSPSTESLALVQAETQTSLGARADGGNDE